MDKSISILSICALVALAVAQSCLAQSYLWSERYDSSTTVGSRIQVPTGFVRVPNDTGSFGEWVRGLPLKPPSAKVHLFDGREKSNQSAHVAVVDIDIGIRDLQQCADAVIRLQAEYYYSHGKYDDICYEFTSGDTASFRKWIEGFRPTVSDTQVAWRLTATVDSSYSGFRRYLQTVFMYAGTISLSRQLVRKTDMAKIAIGDIFIQSGSPGHAVMVVDVARNTQSGEKVFLLAQSYMPAQDIHILKNPMDSELSPWYSVDFGETLRTPEWTFQRDYLKTRR